MTIQTDTNQNNTEARQAGKHLKTHRDSGCFTKLFENHAQSGKPYLTLSIGRTFVDAASGEFKDTNNFSLVQARKLMAVLQAALDDARDIEAGYKQARYSDAPENSGNDAEDAPDHQPQ